MFLSAFYVSGVRNVIADGLSRNSTLSLDWTLDKGSFRWMLAQTSIPQVDLLATRENAHLPVFVSPVLDVKATAIDAFTLDWNRWKVIYLFLPSSMISRVLSHLEAFQGVALLIAPLWPNQPWFPLLAARAKSRIPLPDPVLSQVVGEQTVFCKSRVLLQLACWIL